MNKKIYLIGMPNAGKTTIAKRLASRLKVECVCLDSEVAKNANISVPEIIEKFGETYFRTLESKALQKVSTNKDALIIDCGGGVILTPINKTHMQGTIFYIYRDLDDIAQGFCYKNRPHLKNKCLKQLYETRKDKYEDFADFTIENDSIDHAVNEIIKVIENESY